MQRADSIEMGVIQCLLYVFFSTCREIATEGVSQFDFLGNLATMRLGRILALRILWEASAIRYLELLA